tara:strand:+ start:198881 stop:199555 length:675 start_codon:yes stop_codon:yes gene_type:complete
MKKGLLLILGMLMMVSTAEATDGAKLNSITDYTVKLHGTKSIKFVERGVLFNISPNGTVNFDRLNTYKTQYYYRNGKRSKKFIPQKRLRVERDFLGKVIRVGAVPLQYNRFGKITRIGSVYIDYNRTRMTQIGDLHISYDRFGKARYFGEVKPLYSNHLHTGAVYNYNDRLFSSTNFYDQYDHYREDSNYFYYKSKGAKDPKKVKIIKRKKAKKEVVKDRKRRK